MKMTRKFLFGCLILAGTMSSGLAEQVVLAVPARHDMVNLGFDFVGMFPRDLDLVCYSGSGAEMTIERFDEPAERWIAMTRAEWTRGAPARLIVVGEGVAANSMRSNAHWSQGTTMVDGTRLHEVANAVNSHLTLSPGQWRRLSRTYGFTIEERETERSRYGRYGPPGTRSGRGVRRIVLPLDEPVPAVETWPVQEFAGAIFIPAAAEEAVPATEAPVTFKIEGRAEPAGEAASPAAEAPVLESAPAAVPAASMSPALVAPPAPIAPALPAAPPPVAAPATAVSPAPVAPTALEAAPAAAAAPAPVFESVKVLKSAQMETPSIAKDAGATVSATTAPAATLPEVRPEDK